jgi:DNA repair protein RecO
VTQSGNSVGIIYRIFDTSVADKTINLIDSSGTKRVLIAKGVKKNNSKRSPAIEIGNLVKVNFTTGYNVDILTEISIVNEFANWKKDFDRMLLLQMVCEIIGNFVYEGNSDELIYKILYNTLSSTTNRSKYLIAIFALKILQVSGNLPDLGKDLYTDNQIGLDDSLITGDFVGYRISDINSASIISDRVFKSQRFIENHDIETSLKLKLTEEEENKLFDLHTFWIEKIIDKPLKSKSVINNILK